MSIVPSAHSVNGGSCGSPPGSAPPACPRCLGERVLWPAADGRPAAPVCPWCDDIAFAIDPDDGRPDAPPCPDCGSCRTYWLADADTAEPLVMVCEACVGGDDFDHDADTVLDPREAGEAVRRG